MIFFLGDSIVESIERGICTNVKNGITSDEHDIEIRKKAFGHNEKPSVELKGFF